MRIILTQLKSAQIRQKYNEVLFHYNITQNNYLTRNICSNSKNNGPPPNIASVIICGISMYYAFKTIRSIFMDD